MMEERLNTISDQVCPRDPRVPRGWTSFWVQLKTGINKLGDIRTDKASIYDQTFEFTIAAPPGTGRYDHLRDSDVGARCRRDANE
jgi:hypothetical protein